jgi:hypothetical protein
MSDNNRDAILDILKTVGIDTTEDSVLAGVRCLVTERLALIDANGELASEVKRLTPIEGEIRVLREQLEYMRDLVKTAIVQAGIAEQAHDERPYEQDWDVLQRAEAQLERAEAQRDEARLAWADTVSKYGSQDVGKPEIVFRNLASRYGVDEARRLCPEGES